MSKSLNELFGLLANAGAPRSAEEYRASLAGIRTKIANGGPGSGPHKVGDIVRLHKPGVNGPVKIAGTVKSIRPDGKLEVKTQQDGYMAIHPNEVISNSSTCLQANENDKAKCIADNLGVDKNGKTPLSKIFSKPKITNCGNSADHPKVTNIQGGWNYDPSTDTYSSGVTKLNQSNKQDPWGRPLLMRYLKQHTDDDNDVTHWSGTIQAPPASMGTLGKAAKIKIFND